MNIKTKLSLGLWFLFVVIAAIGLIGSLRIYKMSEESKNILKANYESVEYSKRMLIALDDIFALQNKLLLAKIENSAATKNEYQKAVFRFDSSLISQEHNITEIGEKELTQGIREAKEDLTGSFKENENRSDKKALILMLSEKFMVAKKSIYNVMSLNLQATVRKNNRANENADRSFLIMQIIVAIGVLFAFTFIVNFPGYIANPIKNLTESIKQIAQKNYDQRVIIDRNDEFGELGNAFNKMAVKLKEYESSNINDLLFEKKRTEAIIQNLKDPLIVLDEGKRILFATPEMEKIIGIKEEHLIGKYAPDVATHNDLLRELIKDIMISKDEVHAGTEKPIKIVCDNKECFFNKYVNEISYTPTASEESQLIGYEIVLTNITKYLELDMAKTHFIAAVSHELKTPLSTINLTVKLIEDARVGGLNAEQKKLLNNIKEESGRLFNIINELISFARLETGNIQLNFTMVEPLKVLDYSIEAVRFQAEQKEIRIDRISSDSIPSVRADFEKTTWVMVNLLINAIRYSPSDSMINVAVTVHDKAVIFSVRDQGPGIDPQYKEKVFERYFQIPGSDPSKSGSGIGLTISKEFITAQGGKIWIESELGTGSAFKFSLPIL